MGATSEKRIPTPWYSVWGRRYAGDQPPFYDTTQLPWIQTIEDNWEIMRDELMGLLASEPDRLKPYHINKSMSFSPERWKVLGLYYWNLMMAENCKKCPRTVQLL